MKLLRDVTDEDLARQVQEGSDVAFEQLLDRHQARLMHFLAYQLPTREDAEDVAQQTFLSVYRSIDRFRIEASFATWLYTIARRAAISHYRRNARRRTQPLETAEPAVVSDAGPAEEATRRDDIEAIWRQARSTLTDDAFNVVWLRYREDLSIAEISRVLGRGRVAVRVMLHRARRNVAAALSEQGAHLQPATNPVVSPWRSPKSCAAVVE